MSKKERAINLKPWEVLAFLAGRKTQIRRPVKPQPHHLISDFVDLGDNHWKPLWGMREFAGELGGHEHGSAVEECHAAAAKFNRCIHCPLGAVGDGLWGREAWFDNLASDDGDTAKTPSRCVYRADGEFMEQFPEDYMGGRWSSSVTMPRWASRITLEVVGVRVERVREANRGECMSMGCPFPNIAKETDPVAWLKEQWTRDYDAASWERSDWVWVVDVRAK